MRKAAAIMSVAALALSAGAASAQVPIGEAVFTGYSTGTVIHAHLLQQGQVDPTQPEATLTRFVDADVAFSSAVVDSNGLDGAIHNEWGEIVQPALGENNSYGRGFGLSAAIQDEAGTDEPVIRLAGLAEAVAPPSTDLVTEEIGPVAADPVAYATLVRGQAQALWPGDNVCLEQGDYGFGLGFVDNAELVDSDLTGDAEGDLENPVLATNAEDPNRQVSWAMSHEFLVPVSELGSGLPEGVFGLASETRQTIAPVTFFAGTPAEFTIEILGLWVLRVAVGGFPGTAVVHYGPADTSPTTPVIRVIQGGEVVQQITTQQLLGEEGLVVDLSPVARIAIGEDPRAIGGGPETEPTVVDGTLVAAAVDVVRVELLNLEGLGEVSEVRIGHFEARAQVPEGGILCRQVLPPPPPEPPLPVTGATPLLAVLGAGLIGTAALLRRRSRLG